MVRLVRTYNDARSGKFLGAAIVGHAENLTGTKVCREDLLAQQRRARRRLKERREALKKASGL